MVSISNTNNTSYTNFFNEDYIPNMNEKDALNMNLLGQQAYAQIVVICADLLLYNSTLQSMDLIKQKYLNNINYTPDPDVPALLGTRSLFFASMILTSITSFKYEWLLQNPPDPAPIGIIRGQTNKELLISNILVSLGYTYGVIGIQKVYDSDHIGPIYGI